MLFPYGVAAGPTRTSAEHFNNVFLEMIIRAAPSRLYVSPILPPGTSAIKLENPGRLAVAPSMRGRVDMDYVVHYDAYAALPVATWHSMRHVTTPLRRGSPARTKVERSKV